MQRFGKGKWKALGCLWLAACLALAARGQTRRALLIGIDHYAPPAGAQLPALSAGHALDSRFAPGASWINLNGPRIDVASMQVLLQQTYGFTDVRVLPEEQATRRGILAALDKLTADAQPGDLIVFYYAGHGSQRLDTLSSKNHMDETIVPADAWKGVEDIRDKELAVRFNAMVYDRHARLTAIYDSCHSGTMARGITQSVQRTLPFDDRDVAAEKKNDPTTVTEADLRHIPQRGNAIIVAAASSTESAVEARYPDDHQFHGAFTRALVRVLQASTQTLSAEDVIAEVASMLHADPVPFQQPSVEGRTQESLFGAPVASQTLHVRVSKVAGGKILLDVGSAGGFDTGTQFTAMDAPASVIEVRSVDEPLLATAEVVGGPGTVRVGQVFALSRITYPEAARLTVFAGKAGAAPDAAALAKVKALFPELTWVDDPASVALDYLVVDEGHGWVAYGQNGVALGAGPAARGKAFLLLGVPQSLLESIRQSPPFGHGAFAFSPTIAGANYLLTARVGQGGKAEYALFDPFVLTRQNPEAFVRSTEQDADDATLNGGTNPEVVCRNDVSLPVRTAWLQADAGPGVALALTRRIVRIGKLRLWMQSPSLAPGAGGWPYRLSLTQPNSDAPLPSTALKPNQHYDVRLLASASQIASSPPVPKYGYLFGFDCVGNPYVLYPEEGMNGEATLPQPGQDGVYPKSILLIQEFVNNPLGADTLFFLATREKIQTPSLLMNDGVLERSSRGSGGGFDALISDMSDAGTRGPGHVPTNWLVQQVVVPSRP